jgi:GDP-L-fucose synthase
MPEAIYELRGKRVWVAGHRGMVGSALVRRLAQEACELVTVEREKLDLRRQADTEDWLADARPDAVFLAAARVGGIAANDQRPAEFLYDNLAIAANVIHAAWRTGVRKLLFLGSSCIYPRMAAQPIREDGLLTGPLESTNQWYAVAKIAGLRMCDAYRRQYRCDFISAMPTNLYGPGDNFDLASSHVVAALMRKAHEAKLAGEDAVVVWGTGRPRREVLFVDDAADALVFLMRHYSAEATVNVGIGRDRTVADLARRVAEVVGFDGRLAFDHEKPDGTPRKLLDISRMRALGWQPTTALDEGLRRTYDWFLTNRAAQQGPPSGTQLDSVQDPGRPTAVAQG